MAPVWVVLLWGAVAAVTPPSDLQEVCQFEEFRAECAPGHVVALRTARYGRMSLGKCVRRNLGYVGCYTDALSELDAICSGRNSCKVRVPDLAGVLEKRMTCLQELKSYLEVAYTCVKVMAPPDGPCHDKRPLVAENSSGVLAAAVTYGTGCGTGRAPWIVTVRAGQKINMTLYDFNWTPPESATADSTDSSRVCSAYASITERGRSPQNVCGGGHLRESHVYLSVGNRVEVRLQDGVSGDEPPPYFFIRYHAVGCADPDWSAPYMVERRGEEAVVSCPLSERTWTVICNHANNMWGGTVGNCSKDGVDDGSYGFQLVMGSISMSTEVSIVLVLAIACVIGICILLTGLCYIKRRTRHRNAEEQSSTAAPYGSAPPYESGRNQVTGDNYKRTEPVYTKHYCPISFGVNEYAYILDATAHAREATLRKCDAAHAPPPQRARAQFADTRGYEYDPAGTMRCVPVEIQPDICQGSEAPTTCPYYDTRLPEIEIEVPIEETLTVQHTPQKRCMHNQ